MIRFLDILFSVLGILIGMPILIFSALLSLLDTKNPIFKQVRMGKNGQPFTLFKFRTMPKEQPSIATHLLNDDVISSIGKFLRKNKLDELPQLWNVLKGDMSIVGPRPNLFNQYELMEQRSCLGVYKVLPGITGLSQISNIDMSNPKLLAKTDAKMIADMSVMTYLKFIFITMFGAGRGDNLLNN